MMKFLSALALAASLVCLRSVGQAQSLSVPEQCTYVQSSEIAAQVALPYTVIFFSTPLNQYVTAECPAYDYPGQVYWYTSYASAYPVVVRLNRYYVNHPRWRGPAPYWYYHPVIVEHPRRVYHSTWHPPASKTYIHKHDSGGSISG